ncbi:MAG TPA: uroporphyrinogen decarboxylase family protein [Armatimonadota bacterium]|jgi:uroporphyrinogen decarboxylase
MTKRERIRAALNGQPVDRTPYSLWYHFRLDPPVGEAMAQAELDFYHRYDPDLLKVMHDIPYEMPEGLALVESPADWSRLQVLEGNRGSFGQQLATLKSILAGRGDDGPVVDTVFGTFATAEKVCGKRTLELLRQDPEATHRGLRTITESLCNYARALVASGIDGIYLAISGAASDTMSEDEYRSTFLAYDQQVLAAATGAWLNVAHQHGVGIYPNLVLDLQGYQVYSWSGQLEGNPGVSAIRPKTDLCLLGGVNEATFGKVSPSEVLRQAKEAIAAGGDTFILGPGCAVPTPPDSSDENLKSFQAAVAA